MKVKQNAKVQSQEHRALKNMVKISVNFHPLMTKPTLNNLIFHLLSWTARAYMIVINIIINSNSILVFHFC